MSAYSIMAAQRSAIWHKRRGSDPDQATSRCPDAGSQKGPEGQGRSPFACDPARARRVCDLLAYTADNSRWSGTTRGQREGWRHPSDVGPYAGHATPAMGVELLIAWGRVSTKRRPRSIRDPPSIGSRSHHGTSTGAHTSVLRRQGDGGRGGPSRGPRRTGRGTLPLTCVSKVPRRSDMSQTRARAARVKPASAASGASEGLRRASTPYTRARSDVRDDHRTISGAALGALARSWLD